MGYQPSGVWSLVRPGRGVALVRIVRAVRRWYQNKQVYCSMRLKEDSPVQSTGAPRDQFEAIHVPHLYKRAAVVGTLGHPCRMEELLEVARKYQLHLVEDAAESLGSLY